MPKKVLKGSLGFTASAVHIVTQRRRHTIRSCRHRGARLLLKSGIFSRERGEDRLQPGSGRLQRAALSIVGLTLMPHAAASLQPTASALQRAIAHSMSNYSLVSPACFHHYIPRCACTNRLQWLKLISSCFAFAAGLGRLTSSSLAWVHTCCVKPQAATWCTAAAA